MWFTCYSSYDRDLLQVETSICLHCFSETSPCQNFIVSCCSSFLTVRISQPFLFMPKKELYTSITASHEKVLYFKGFRAF